MESSVEYFEQARAKTFGMPLSELEKTRGGEKAWEAARPGLEELRDFIDSSKKDLGPFLQGSEVCYADFMIATLMESLRRIGEDLYENFVAVAADDSVQKIHSACQKWMVNDQ